MYNLILKSAVESVLYSQNKQTKPSPKEVVNSLIEAEKQARKTNPNYQFQDLIGTWRLCFITGTKKSRQSLEKFIGSGFYVPFFSHILITYSPLDSQLNLNLDSFKAKVENRVKVGLVEFQLTGPAKFIPKKNILAFDFTNLTFLLLGKKIYSGDIRGGKKSEDSFYKNSIASQAFFAYFLVGENLIAARGRGGGLALWGRK
jgi:hypothetical protein